jgi:hypothetical protein
MSYKSFVRDLFEEARRSRVASLTLLPVGLFSIANRIAPIHPRRLGGAHCAKKCGAFAKISQLSCCDAPSHKRVFTESIHDSNFVKDKTMYSKIDI